MRNCLMSGSSRLQRPRDSILLIWSSQSPNLQRHRAWVWKEGD
jgi:hypothetical protein